MGDRVRVGFSEWSVLVRPRVLFELLRQGALLYGFLGRWPGRPKGSVREFRRFRLDTYSPSGDLPPFRAIVEFAQWSAEERRAVRSEYVRQG